MVRLLHFVAAIFITCLNRFNPTMVRLLRPFGGNELSAVSGFQSHNGAIAALSLGAYVNVMLTFQSHNGAITAG